MNKSESIGSELNSVDSVDSVDSEQEQEQVIEQIKTNDKKPQMQKITEQYNYDCSNCNSNIILLSKESIVCKSCGSRVLFKKRINKKVEYLAR
jgi:DNA-directed RNA polymerase subunit RPC12/RpoP